MTGRTDWRSKALIALQNRFRSVVKPMHDEETAFRTAVMERLEASLSRTILLDNQVQNLYASVLQSRWMETPDVLLSRSEVGPWLNWLGLGGEGVEVGVYRGEFSRDLLRSWHCTRLNSIDPWKEFPAGDYPDVLNTSQPEQDASYAHASSTLAPFASRSRILRLTSDEGAKLFPEKSLDFVYLDAQHHYEAVRDDIGLWRSKVASGGVIGGHDYFDGARTSGLYGVKQAVDEFVAQSGYSLIVTREPNWPSWFAKVV
jgi:hypothetical protein